MNAAPEQRGVRLRVVASCPVRPHKTCSWATQAVAATAKTWLIGLLIAVWFVSVASAAQQRWQPEAPAYGVARLSNVPITMSDGTILRADVDVPVPAGHTQPVPGLRFPTLVTQTAYYKDGPVAKLDPYFAQRGYVEVLADVRGTGSSAGQWQMLGPLEQEDGVQVIHWAARQSWSDGRIGLMGSSYGAINQLLIMERPDAPREVKAILPVAPMADPYRDLVFHGGAFDAEFMSQWLGLTAAAGLVPPQQVPSGDPGAAMIGAEHLAGLNLSTTVVANAALGGSLAYDGPFWQDRAPITHIERIRVPTMIVGGEFDVFQRGEPLLFQRLTVRAKRMIIGPWTHSDVGSTLPADGIPDRDVLALKWFDQYVKGEKAGEQYQPAVEQYRLQGSTQSHFVASRSWPLPGLHALDLYLSDSASGTARSLHDGSLSLRAPSISREELLPYNPTGTPCTRASFQWGNEASANNESSSTLPCEGDQRVDEAQALTYTTPALTAPLTIDGPIDLHLIARSPLGRDTLFSVTLSDVMPNGTSVGLTGGWLVASMRQVAQSPIDLAVDGQPLRVLHPFTPASQQAPPATPTTYDIEIFPTYATFRAGDRLRLDVGTGQIPHLLPSTPQATSSVGGAFEIESGPGALASHLILPAIGRTDAHAAHRQSRRPNRPRTHGHAKGSPERHRRPHHHRRARRPHQPTPSPTSQITYGLSPTASISDPSSATGQLAFRHLDELRHGNRLLVHLYLPWSGYPGNLAGIDRMVAALGARAYQVDIVLRYAPPNGHDGDIAGYAQFVRAVVDHFAKQPAVVRLGITNESNFGLDQRGSLGGSDGQYTDPVGALIAGMNAAYHERARVHAHVKLGFNWAYRGCDQTNCGPTADNDYWTGLGRRGGARFAQEVDWVTMDIYPGTIFPPGDPSADPYHPGLTPKQEIATAIEDLRYQMMPLAGLRMNVPIGIQEISWASLPPVRTEAQQATLLDQFAAGACEVAAQTNFRTFYWFTLNDPPPSSGGLDFGLYHADGTPKSAAAAFAGVIAHGCPSSAPTTGGE